MRARESEIAVEMRITKEEDPYGMALKGDYQGFLDYFGQRTAEELLGYRAVNRDSKLQ